MKWLCYTKAKIDHVQGCHACLGELLEITVRHCDLLFTTYYL